jgi:hypothetical protein
MERGGVADEVQDGLADPTCRKAWEAVNHGNVAGLEALLTSAEVRTPFWCPPSWPSKCRKKCQSVCVPVQFQELYTSVVLPKLGENPQVCGSMTNSELTEEAPCPGQVGLILT